MNLIPSGRLSLNHIVTNKEHAVLYYLQKRTRKHLQNYSLSAVNMDTTEQETGVAIRGNNHIPAMTIMLWNHFQEQPGMLHEVYKNGYYPGGESSKQILDITGGLGNDALAIFDVHSLDDFNHTSYDIQNKLLLFRTKIKHERVIRVSDKHSNREWWKDEFAVLVNTSSEEIRDQLVSRLQQAREDFEKGKNFVCSLTLAKV
ncbi:unnamed protein product [Mytilus edulis]|uniref:Uncharacterized protein n=1 Tax=Mytilus edulis TaxID=6550 RepID=A0A8S3VIU5_MYTED|nr:unnamed protein product [Mytilus edulis]